MSLARSLRPSIVDLRQYNLQPQWTGYVLECYPNAFYIGMTDLIDRRLGRHIQQRQGAKFTEKYPPLALVELYFCKSEKEARAWESQTLKEFKRMYPTLRIGGGANELNHHLLPKKRKR